MGWIISGVVVVIFIAVVTMSLMKAASKTDDELGDRQYEE